MSLLVRARERAVPLALSAALPVLAQAEGRFPFRSPAAIERAQRRRLRATVAHAHRHVPYYRETMRRLGLGPGDITTAADLAKLPVIERHQLQRDPEYFCSERHPPSECLEQASGGSTGEPVRVFWDRTALVRGAAHRERQRRVTMALAGRRGRLREVRITPKRSRTAAYESLDSSSRAAAMFARSSLLPASLRVKREVLSVFDPPSENLPVINGLRPDVIATHGSYVETLFSYLLRTRKGLEGSPVIVFGADPLSPTMREAISRRFGLEVVSVYQCVEMPQIAFECDRGAGLHLNVDLCALRVLDSAGRDAPAGSPGDAVASNLVGRGTVLLNYRLGDVVAVMPHQCPCGRRLPLISLEGRSDEWVEAADGSRLHPRVLRATLTSDPRVMRYQVSQAGPGRLVVSIVPSPGADRGLMRSELEEELGRRLGRGAAITVELTETLPTSPGGKVLPVISLETGRASQG